jgi:hypothetical protein
MKGSAKKRGSSKSELETYDKQAEGEGFVSQPEQLANSPAEMQQQRNAAQLRPKGTQSDGISIASSPCTPPR